MNEKQREMARHALGLPNSKHISYRNHYCIGPAPSMDSHEQWLDMVAKGWAIRRTGPHWGGDDMFKLTLSGAQLARENNEHLSQEDCAEMRTFA